jgi:hypothetical protein
MVAKLFAFGAFLLLVAYFTIPTVYINPRSTVEVAIFAEIDQLHNSLEGYQEKSRVYPPSLAQSAKEIRKSKFMSHLQAVYPTSAYGESPADFDQLNASVASNYQVAGPKEASLALDLLNLDAAESLVFWLGGFPTPSATGTGGGRPIAPDPLFGFNVDSDDPLKRSLKQEGADPLATRTSPRFDFRRERLVDNDEDGWWEYVPTPPSIGAAVAPYVYFDFESYASAKSPAELPIYPRPGDLQAEPLSNVFGTAVPFAAHLDPSGKTATRWQHPTSFQIICGGLDGQYADAGIGRRVPVFPKGFTYLGPKFNGTPTNYSEAELDNLTNLIRLDLRGARAEAP